MDLAAHSDPSKCPSGVTTSQSLPASKLRDTRSDHEVLHEQGIKPVIHNRSCWPKDGEQEKGIGARIPLHVVPHPPSDAASGLHRVQAPFLPDAASRRATIDLWSSSA